MNIEEKRRTILLSIYNGMRSRYFFRTDIFPELKNDQGIRLVILAPSHKIDFYRKEFGAENVIFEPWDDMREPRLGRALFSVSFSLLDTGTIRAKQKIAYERDRNFLKFSLKRAFTILFGNSKFLRKIIRALDKYVGVNKEIAELLKKYRPEIVLAPDIILPSDRILLRTAKQLGILTVGMVRSWDNLTAKGVIQVLPDKLISQTHAMKDEAIRFADMNPEDIVVLGVPQFDMYFKPARTQREDFLKKLGIPEDKKIILCAPFFAEYANSSSIEIIKALERAIRENRLPENTHLLVRYRPESRDAGSWNKDGGSEHVTFTKPYSLLFPRGKGKHPDFEMSEEDTELLENSLRFSDVTINTISTLTVDAVALDKPVINVRFDGDPNVPPAYRVALYSNFDHYRVLEETGGVRLAFSMGELITQCNDYLKHPQKDAEGRKKVREQQIEFLDGNSGKRVAAYLKTL